MLDTGIAIDSINRRNGVFERAGRPIQVMDRLIAAIALSLSRCTVVSGDSDLRSVPGLDVVSWAE